MHRVVGARSGSSRRGPRRAAAPTAAATATKSSLGGTPRATSVATRRSAACSSASRASWSCASVLEIAVATSSVNSARRSSVSVGQGLAPVEWDDDGAPDAGRRRGSGAPAHASGSRSRGRHPGSCRGTVAEVVDPRGAAGLRIRRRPYAVERPVAARPRKGCGRSLQAPTTARACRRVVAPASRPAACRHLRRPPERSAANTSARRRPAGHRRSRPPQRRALRARMASGSRSTARPQAVLDVGEGHDGAAAAGISIGTET